MKNRYLPLLVVGIILLKTSSVWAEEETDYTQMIRIADFLNALDTGEQGKGRAMLSKANHGEERLIALLDDMNMRTNKPGVVGAAITILGELKSTNAVDRIAAMLVYNGQTGRDFKEEDWFRGRRKAGNPRMYAYFLCPAREALVKIGQPSVGAILRRISAGRWSKEDFSSPEYQWREKYNYAYYFARWVLWMIVGQDRNRTYDTIEIYKKTLTDLEAEKRIDEFLDFCRTQE